MAYRDEGDALGVKDERRRQEGDGEAAADEVDERSRVVDLERDAALQAGGGERAIDGAARSEFERTIGEGRFGGRGRRLRRFRGARAVHLAGSVVHGGTLGHTSHALAGVPAFAATWAPSLALFLAGGLVAGAGAGLLFKGGIVTVSGLAAAERRAEVLAGFFLAGYAGISVPVLGLGVLDQLVEPKVALLAFAAFLLAGIAASARTLLGGGTVTLTRAQTQSA